MPRRPQTWMRAGDQRQDRHQLRVQTVNRVIAMAGDPEVVRFRVSFRAAWTNAISSRLGREESFLPPTSIDTGDRRIDKEDDRPRSRRRAGAP